MPSAARLAVARCIGRRAKAGGFSRAPETLTNSEAVSTLTASLLARGCCVRFHATGRSMHPTIRDGEALLLAPIRPTELRKGDIVLSRQSGRLVAHRVVKLTNGPHARAAVLLRGDASSSCDPPIEPHGIIAKVVAVERDRQAIDLTSGRAKAAYLARTFVRTARGVIAKLLRPYRKLAAWKSY